MRVLFASRRPAYPFFQGGAERSFYEMARALAAGGHTVAMLGECRQEPDRLNDLFTGSDVVGHRWYSDVTQVQGRSIPARHVLALQVREGFEVLHTFLADYRRLLENVVRDFAPDIVCTQLEGSLEVVEFSGLRGSRVWHFVRDTYYPFNFHVLAGVPGAMPAPVCIANSRHTADFVRATFGVDARVIHPIVRMGTAPAADGARFEHGPRVLFVNPVSYKGGDVIFDVARQLTDMQFVVLPGWGVEVPDRWRRLPNVEAHAWPVRDMATAYRSVDLVLLPTQTSEGFGRVAIEAQACGTPVLASRHSALEEVLAGSAVFVDDYGTPEAWARAIRAALADRERLARLVDAGRVNAARFAPEPIREAFERLARDLGMGG